MSTQEDEEVALYSKEWPVQSSDIVKAIEYQRLIRDANWPYGIHTKAGLAAFRDLIMRSTDHFRIAAMEMPWLRDDAADWESSMNNTNQYPGRINLLMAWLYTETRRYRPGPSRTVERTGELDVIGEALGSQLLGLIQPKINTSGFTGLSANQQILAHHAGQVLAELLHPEKESREKLTNNAEFMHFATQQATARAGMAPLVPSIQPKAPSNPAQPISHRASGSQSQISSTSQSHDESGSKNSSHVGSVSKSNDRSGSGTNSHHQALPNDGQQNEPSTRTQIVAPTSPRQPVFVPAGTASVSGSPQARQTNPATTTTPTVPPAHGRATLSGLVYKQNHPDGPGWYPGP